MNRTSLYIIWFVLACTVNQGWTQSDTGDKWPSSSLLFAADETIVPGHEDGVPENEFYQCFREPVAVKTNTGRIVVGCHAGNKLEWPERSGQDYVIRYSDDGGSSWSIPVLVAEHGNYSVQSHGMVYDGVIDRIIVKYIIYRWDYSKVKGRGLEASAPVISEVLNAGKDLVHQYEVYSDNGGESWSRPKKIPIKNKHDMPHFGSSEGRQLTTGKCKGRLIIPGGIRTEEMGDVLGKTAGIWYSDDHGQNWDFVKIIENDPDRISCEARVTEMSDGSLLYNMRTRYDGRFLARSTDGGETWSEPLSHLDLKVTQCNGSMITLRDENGQLTSNLLFSIPSPGGRNDGYIYVSKDDGKTWPIKHQLVDGFFAYSSLIQVNPGNVCLFYEADQYKNIRWILVPILDLLKE